MTDNFMTLYIVSVVCYQANSILINLDFQLFLVRDISCFIIKPMLWQDMDHSAYW